MTNEALLQKAFIAISDLAPAGVLPEERAKQFIEDAIAVGKIIKMADVKTMSSHTGRYPAIKFGTRILNAGVEGSRASTQAKPTTRQIYLETKLYKGEVPLSDEVLEDNIEGERFLDTLQKLIAERVGQDCEEIALYSDTANTTDTTLAQFDGLLKTAGHVYDAAGAELTLDLFATALQQIPYEYRQRKTEMVAFASPSVEERIRVTMANRFTPLGDVMYTDNQQVKLLGVPVVDTTLPEDTTNKTGTILVTFPKNVLVGFWRQVKIEPWRDPREGVLYIITTVRFAATYYNPDAVLKIVNVKYA